MVKEYAVVCKRSALELSRFVNDLMTVGWNLQGGICVYRDEIGNFWFCQAVVRLSEAATVS